MTIPYEVVEDIQLEVNFKVTYEKDSTGIFNDDWKVLSLLDEKPKGDCEDYALTKRKLLLDLGYSTKDISIITCWIKDVGYHAALIVNTTKGQYVLDNNFKYPKTKKELEQAGYIWDKIEKEGKWYKLS